MGGTVFAVGWDDASVILKVLDTGLVDKSYDDAVQTCASAVSSPLALAPARKRAR
jgi:hypothetical protein